MMTPRERRYKVNIRVDCATRDMFVSNRVTNISRGGIFVQSDHPIPFDSEVDLRLVLPQSHMTIAAKGRVVWTYDVQRGTGRLVPGAGIKFIDMSPSDRALIEQYLEGLAAQQPAPPDEPLPGSVSVAVASASA
jgi:type IV pilus assembly protein PilZ